MMSMAQVWCLWCSSSMTWINTEVAPLSDINAAGVVCPCYGAKVPGDLAPGCPQDA